jgi:glyoxylase-like metal-dependent hydrolase (beta-lactamase superfamily II)
MIAAAAELGIASGFRMIKRALILAIFLTICCNAVAQDAQSVVAGVARSMGVQDLSAINTYTYAGSGAVYKFGEWRSPNTPWPKSNVSGYRRIIDFIAGGSLETITHESSGATAGSKDQVETRRIPFVEHYGKQGTRQYDIWITPLAFLKAAASNSATVEVKAVNGRQYRVLSVPFQKKYKIEGFIDSDDRLERVQVHVDHPVLGDMLVEARYSGYTDFQHGLTFPSKILVNEGGYPVLDLTVTDAVPNVIAQVDDTPVLIPAESAGAEYAVFRGRVPPIHVDEAVPSPGVHYYGFRDDSGELHHTVMVEFNDYLVLIEAPVDQEHSAAVITEIRKEFGSKPIRYVVNTHAHFTAAGGLRKYAAEGATILTHEGNKAYYDQLLPRPHAIEGVAGKKVLSDGTHTIELYAIRTGHVDGMLIAYLPKEKIVVESDLYVARDPHVLVDDHGNRTIVPKQPEVGFASDLSTALSSLKLEFRQVLCLRGRAAAKDEFLEDIKGSSN